MSIAREGHNCWRRTTARRLAFLVDGAAYFHALGQALENAERSVLILGWEFDGRTRLGRRDEAGDRSVGELFQGLLGQRPDLHIHVLIWKSALIYSLDRELLPVLKHDWLSHRRLHFRLDSCHPIGASHHQKVVVIDDRLAFVGGFDIAAKRWDTSRHQPFDPRRSDPGFPNYGPFHDVQVAVSGPAAAVLGDLARRRWLTATGQSLSPPPPTAAEPWPDGLAPDVTDTAVAIARTGPSWRGGGAVTEIRSLLVDLLNAARSTVYIENQYFASRQVSRALFGRLSKPGCPEVAVVTSGCSGGWLEERSMGLSRCLIQARLHDIDRNRRLRFYCPEVGGQWLKVHSKLMIIDDRFLCVGSSNLNNRSLGLDSECNLLLEAAARPDIAAAIAGLRDRLLGEHLDAAPAVVAEAMAQSGMHDTIRGLAKPGRHLAPLTIGEIPTAGPLDVRSLDPEGPLETALLAAGPAGLRLAGGVLLLAGLIIPATLEPVLPAAVMAEIRGDPLSPLLLCGLFLMFGMTGLPIFLPMVAAGSLFGAATGSLYALLGALASAAFSYSLGRSLGRPVLRRLAGRRMQWLGRALLRHGVIALAALRLLPVASFASVSLAAGAQRLPAKTYFAGTAIGSLPVVVTFSLFGDRFAAQLQSPAPLNMLWLAMLAMVPALAGAGLVYRMLRALERKGSRR
ncbi:MAG TPA: hypothetical protein HPQ04_05095 [Rhodospirillaceae bacterium]|nr:hypothetical protein [Rhodospirillaceae bacterium]